MTTTLALLTYRSGFAITALSPDGRRETLTTDFGWGCTLRAAQTLAACAFRLKTSAELASTFADETGGLGLAALLRAVPGGDATRWRGPAEACRMLARAAAGQQLPTAIVCAIDYTVVLDELFPASSASTTLLLLPVRLAPDGTRLSAASVESLRQTLALPSCVGFVAGTPGHAFCVVASDGADFIALDPHRVQDSAVTDLAPLPSDSRVVRSSELDASVAFGFLLKLDALEAFREALTSALPCVSIMATRTGAGAAADELAEDGALLGGGWVDAASAAESPSPAPSVAAGGRWRRAARAWAWLVRALRARWRAAAAAVSRGTPRASPP